MSALEARLAAAKAKRDAELKKTPASAGPAEVPEPWLDAVPEVTTEVERSNGEGTSDAAVAAVLDNIGILEAYQRWCGKTKNPKLDKRGEYIVSCPNPAHPDRNPSARLDPRTNVWNCWGCGADFGGGVIALAALSFGFDMRPTGQDFHELRRQMAMSMGHTFIRDSRGVWQMDSVRTVSEAPPRAVKAAPAPKAATPRSDVPADDETPAEELFREAKKRRDAPKPEPEPISEEESEWLNESLGLSSETPTPSARTATASPSPSPTPTPQKAAPSPSPKQTDPSSSETPNDSAPKSTTTPAPADESPTATAPASTPPATSSPDDDPKPAADDETVAIPNDRIPAFDWRTHIPRETPIYRYMEIVTADDAPEEYHLMNYMMAIGLACGKNAFLEDEIPVYGNLITCIIGRSGVGKSRSERHIDNLVKKVLPFESKVWDTDGVKMVRKPGSGEWLAKCFVHETEEAEDPRAAAHHEKSDGSQPAVKWKGGTKVEPKVRLNPSVRGLITWPEMSSMIGGKKREGSTIDTAIEVYDVPDSIGGGSLTNKEYIAHNPFGSIRTTTQFATLRRLVGVDDASSGFLPRVWFVMGPEKRRYPRGPRIDISPAMNGLLSIKKWADAKMRDSAGSHELTTESGEVFDHFIVNRIYPLQKEAASINVAIYNRLDHAFKKMVFLFSANRTEEVVSVESVELAKKFFEWHLRCMNMISGYLVGGERAEQEELITKTIVAFQEKKRAYPTVRDLYDFALKNTMQLDVLKHVITGLVNDHMIEEVMLAGDTRQRVRYDIIRPD